MNTSDKPRAVRTNTMLWIAAMVLPGILHLALGSTRFPWPVVIPLLLFGPMLVSNQLLAKAIGKPADDGGTEK